MLGKETLNLLPAWQLLGDAHARYGAEQNYTPLPLQLPVFVRP